MTAIIIVDHEHHFSESLTQFPRQYFGTEENNEKKANSLYLVVLGSIGTIYP
jgi:hypothetical protein